MPVMVRMPALCGKPDWPATSPLEPPVQGRKHTPAQAGDAALSANAIICTQGFSAVLMNPPRTTAISPQYRIAFLRCRLFYQN